LAGVFGQERGDGSDSLVDLAPQGPPVRRAGRLDVFERDRLPGMLGADRPAQEPVAVEHPELGEVAGS